MSDCTALYVPFENDLKPLQRDSVPSGGRFRRVTPSSEREYNMLDTDRASDSLADTDADDDEGVCVGDGGDCDDDGGGDCDESSDVVDCDDDDDDDNCEGDEGVCVRGCDVADVDAVTSLTDTIDDVVD